MHLRKVLSALLDGIDQPTGSCKPPLGILAVHFFDTAGLLKIKRLAIAISTARHVLERGAEHSRFSWFCGGPEWWIASEDFLRDLGINQIDDIHRFADSEIHG